MAPRDPLQVLDRLESLLGEPGGGGAASGWHWLAPLAGARDGALLAIEQDSIASESWTSPAPTEELRGFLRTLSLQSARGVSPDLLRAPLSLGEIDARVWLLRTGAHVHGALVLAAPAPGLEPDGIRMLERVLPILAHAMRQQRDSARARASQDQYDHWFKMLEPQLRVLERERQKLAAIVNQTDLYAATVDPAGKLQWTSRPLSQRTAHEGQAPGWMGRPYREVLARLGIGEHDLDASPGPVEEALHGGAPVHREFSVRDEQQTRTLYLTALPIAGPEGAVQEVLLLMQDLSDLESLRGTQLRLQTVVSNFPIALFALDPNGVITLSEGKGFEGLGLEPGATVGQSALELYRRAPPIVALLERSLQGEEVHELVTVEEHTFETRLRPLRDAAGKVERVIGVATDVTERTRLEEELRRAQRLESVGRLAAAVSHDFNNVLTAIMGHGQLLGLRLGAEHPSRGSIDEIHRAGARGAAVTRQLLEIARSEGTPPIGVDLRALIARIEPTLRRWLGPGSPLRVVSGDEKIWARVVPSSLEHVILQLVLNARETGPQAAEIFLHARIDGEHADLAVKAGSPPDRSVTEDPRAAGSRSGFGMSVAGATLGEWGGEVGAAAGVSGGMVFYLRLPAHLQKGDMPPRLRMGSNPPATILLVEDEAPIRRPLRQVLEVEGYQVLEAANAEEGLRVARRPGTHFDLVITDIVMGAKNGVELVRELRAERPDLPALFMSGYTDQGIPLDEGMEGSAFLSKPFRLDMLTRQVRELLEHSAGRRKAA